MYRQCVLCVHRTAGEATSPTTLAESAALQQAKHCHVELKKVEVVTGEEDESNVFQVTSLLTRVLEVQTLLVLVCWPPHSTAELLLCRGLKTFA